MRRLKKNIYLGICGGIVGVLAVIRICQPSVVSPTTNTEYSQDTIPAPVETALAPAPQDSLPKSIPVPDTTHTIAKLPSTLKYPDGVSRPFHPIFSVPSFSRTFPDVQDVQIQAARQWGVSPVQNRRQAEERKSELVYVGANPYYCMDSNMQSSIPYLVPRAASLLQTVGRNFLDSLYVKGIPLHRIIVSSVLRTEEDIARLRRHNQNASPQSCHRFGTTFDICYNRYSTVSPPDESRRAVQNDTLKWVLSEVLRDVRQQKRCFIKYEVKQGCFHITVR